MLEEKKYLSDNHKMRKKYEQPSVSDIVLVPFAVLAISGSEKEPGSSVGSGTVSPEESWAGESRGDWADIWSNL